MNGPQSGRTNEKRTSTAPKNIMATAVPSSAVVDDRPSLHHSTTTTSYDRTLGSDTRRCVTVRECARRGDRTARRTLSLATTLHPPPPSNSATPAVGLREREPASSCGSAHIPRRAAWRRRPSACTGAARTQTEMVSSRRCRTVRSGLAKGQDSFFQLRPRVWCCDVFGWWQWLRARDAEHDYRPAS